MLQIVSHALVRPHGRLTLVVLLIMNYIHYKV